MTAGQGRPRAELAAMNNAVWCDTVCRAHGVPGEFVDGLWRLRQVPPPYHSNIVVVRAGGMAHAVAAQVHALLALPLAPRWSVKDSHAELDLAPLGFEPLFDASWIWLDGSPAMTPTSAALAWQRIESPAALDRWEHGWSNGGTDPTMAGRPAQFPPALLADPDVVFFAGNAAGDRDDHAEILAGGIANRSGPVVGLSNTFGHAALWPGLIAAAQAAFPGLPLVGYERGDDLRAAQDAGFEVIGALRVWIRRE